MEVVFAKLAKGRCCQWTAHLPKRRPIVGPAMAVGADLPHDLFGFVAEQALGLEHGFWGTVAAGGVFKSMPAKVTERSRAVMQRNRPELDRSEGLVHAQHAAWHAGQPTEPAELGAAFDDMLERWRALGEGEAIVLTWSGPSRRAVSPVRARSGAAPRNLRKSRR